MIYDAFKIEKKWQKYWSDKNSFESNVDFKKKKILHTRNVSLSIRKNPYGSLKELYYW